MKKTSVTLAGRTYVVESLKFKAEREWRKKYDAPIGNLIGAIGNLQGIGSKQFEKAGDLLKEVGATLLSNAGSLLQAMLDSPDIIFNAICDYSPTIQADKAYIEENAYQDEIAAAFVEVLKIAYPFGKLLGIVTSLGSQEKQTTQSSPSVNGDSTTTN